MYRIWAIVGLAGLLIFRGRFYGFRQHTSMTGQSQMVSFPQQLLQDFATRVVFAVSECRGSSTLFEYVCASVSFITVFYQLTFQPR
ncbi:hypothetical protein EDB19DRAFT_1701840 [Suillus lakei]|nr:hypothetical protein EDB19DRAFT_1701840 [Suillus lakei]